MIHVQVILQDSKAQKVITGLLMPSLLEWQQGRDSINSECFYKMEK